MALTLSQIVKVEKVSKGRAMQRLPIHFEFLHPSLLKRRKMNNLCGDVQPRAWMCAPEWSCLTIPKHMFRASPYG